MGQYCSQENRKDGANSKVYAKFGVEIYVAAKRVTQIQKQTQR